MKKIIRTIFKILFIVLILVWMGLLITDYFRAKNGVKPMICFSEQTKKKENATYYECKSLGYKYYEYTKENQKEYGFGAIFLTNDAEKEMSEQNE